jgi:hypothetical protein
MTKPIARDPRGDPSSLGRPKISDIVPEWINALSDQPHVERGKALTLPPGAFRNNWRGNRRAERFGGI